MGSEIFTIFYTDDDRDDREFFVDAARDVSADLKVITQPNGDELLRQLKNPPPYPTIIFLDLNMPIKNGYVVLKEIKQSAHLKDLPVVIFSTSSDSEAIDTTRQLGANLYITKPSNFSLLREVIKYSPSINWATFAPSEHEFVYRSN
jgi:CheY-like chemotaxis protein